jgi:hypothetical protein
MKKFLNRTLEPTRAAQFLAAICLFLSPWALHFASHPAPAWNAWVDAVVIALLTFFTFARLGGLRVWCEGAMGIWVLISPWVLGFAALAHATWAHVALGAVVIVASAIELGMPRQGGRKLA